MLAVIFKNDVGASLFSMPRRRMPAAATCRPSNIGRLYSSIWPELDGELLHSVVQVL